MNPLAFSQPHKPFEFIEREVDVDGSVYTWLRSPFPKREFAGAVMRLPRHAETVRIADLVGTQRGVTEVGLKKYRHRGSRELPIVYRDRSGELLILDGHHRLAAALLRGEKTAEVAVIEAQA